MLTLSWQKCGEDGHWCSFDDLDLSHSTVNVTGVYVIWHTGNPSKVVRVGQGDVAKRIAAHRNDADCTMYRQHGMKVTWAAVPAQYLDGVENYLADHYNPLVGERFPNVPPIAVNLPG